MATALYPEILTPDADLASRGDHEALIFRFLREAPFLPDAGDLGIATAGVEPWPHQLRVARRCVERFPENVLLADEVGLGKTVEAGLALRQLVISGRVRRALLLVPRAVLRQWQEELWEKFALAVPRYTGGVLRDVHDREVVPAGGEPVTAATGRPAARNVWNAASLVLVSTQLAQRRDRQAEILAADPWDLVLVDEAHHARRRDRRPGRPAPNRLLELLAGHGGRRGLRDRTRCLYLLTATPMQIHPVEVWDLLKVLGLGGRWGAHEDDFLRFYDELGRPFAERDWNFLLAMTADHLDGGGRLAPSFVRAAEDKLGESAWETVRDLPWSRQPAKKLARLDAAAKAVLDAMLRLHTPLRAASWRNTREQLRRYHREGRIVTPVPTRRPEDVWIDLSAAERGLYDRIEAYLGEVYQRYEAERPGLGFVMTVLRRRLTSSFYALHRSLERRRRDLEARGEPFAAPARVPTLPGLVDDDLDADDLDELDLSETGGDEDEPGAAVRDEIAHLDAFLGELELLDVDSKLRRLRRDLERLLAERPSVLVFTQYTDTLDHLRRALQATWGDTVACTSGRGAEVWDGSAWKTVPKETLKEAFGTGEVRVLIATDAASEGLNLQTCGVLINYDMPWNPMRVEQRIGRLDRLGQRFDEVQVLNYFYADTVEATVYQRLGDRIRAFETVVGGLQPILHKIGDVIRLASMLAPGQRRRFERELAELENEAAPAALGAGVPELGAFEAEGFAAENAEEGDEALRVPVSLPEIEAAVVGSKALGGLLRADPEVPGAYRLAWDEGEREERRVTFQPAVFDRHPSSVELLTYGNPTFAALLERAEPPATRDEPAGLGLYRTVHPYPVGMFLLPGEDGAAAVPSLAVLRARLAFVPGRWTGGQESQATTVFSRARQVALRAAGKVEEGRRRAEREALREAARRVLVRSALIEIARDRGRGLFDEPLPWGFGPSAVAGLARHGTPFPELLELAGELSGSGSPSPQARGVGGEGPLEALPEDPFWERLRGRSRGWIERQARALAAEAGEILAELTALDLADAAARERWREPSATGLLERVWFPLGGLGAGPTVYPFRFLPAEEADPFVNAVPLYDTLESAAERFRAALAGEALQDDERRHPGGFTWIEPQGRQRPDDGLFVVQVWGEALNRRVSSGSWCLFRFAPRQIGPSRIVLVEHPALRDPELGGHLSLRLVKHDAIRFPDGSWHERRVVLEPASSDPVFEPLALEDPDELVLIAELVEVLG